MGVNILETLMNAEFNFRLCPGIAREQLHNAIVLLDKGYDIYDEVSPLLEKHARVENVPDKEEKDE